MCYGLAMDSTPPDPGRVTPALRLSWAGAVVLAVIGLVLLAGIVVVAAGCADPDAGDTEPHPPHCAEHGRNP